MAACWRHHTKALEIVAKAVLNFDSALLSEKNEASISKYYPLEHDGTLRVPIAGMLSYVLDELPSLRSKIRPSRSNRINWSACSDR
jgi:hypothetical protein